MNWLQKFHNDWSLANHPREPIPESTGRYSYRPISLDDRIKQILTRTTFQHFDEACQILLNRGMEAVDFANGLKVFSETGDITDEVKATWDWRSQEIDGEKQKSTREQFGRALTYVSDEFRSLRDWLYAFPLVCDTSGRKDSEIKHYWSQNESVLLELSWRIDMKLFNAGRWLEVDEPPKLLAEYLAANPDVEIHKPEDFAMLLLPDAFLLNQRLIAYVNEGKKYVEMKKKGF